MPLYHWVCTKCAKEIDVVRKADDIEVQPVREEDYKDETRCEHEWDRQFGGAPAVIRGHNWGGGKGNW